MVVLRDQACFEAPNNGAEFEPETGRGGKGEPDVAERVAEGFDVVRPAIGPSVPGKKVFEYAHGEVLPAPDMPAGDGVGNLVPDIDVNDIDSDGVAGGGLKPDVRERDGAGADLAGGVGGGVERGDIIKRGAGGLGDGRAGDEAVKLGRVRDDLNNAVVGVGVGEEREGEENEFELSDDRDGDHQVGTNGRGASTLVECQEHRI